MFSIGTLHCITQLYMYIRTVRNTIDNRNFGVSIIYVSTYIHISRHFTQVSIRTCVHEHM